MGPAFSNKSSLAEFYHSALPRSNLLVSSQARAYIRSLPPMKPKDFKQFFRGANPLGKWVSDGGV